MHKLILYCDVEHICVLFQSALESKKNCKVYGKSNSSALTGVLSAKQGTTQDFCRIQKETKGFFTSSLLSFIHNSLKEWYLEAKIQLICFQYKSCCCLRRMAAVSQSLHSPLVTWSPWPLLCWRPSMRRTWSFSINGKPTSRLRHNVTTVISFSVQKMIEDVVY